MTEIARLEALLAGLQQDLNGLELRYGIGSPQWERCFDRWNEIGNRLAQEEADAGVYPDYSGGPNAYDPYDGPANESEQSYYEGYNLTGVAGTPEPIHRCSDCGNLATQCNCEIPF